MEEFGLVEERYTKLNALQAVKLRKEDPAIYHFLRDYMAGRETRDPDRFIGAMLKEGLALARTTTIEEAEMERHLRLYRDGEQSKLDLCHAFRRGQQCTKGNMCKYVHATNSGRD